MNAVGAFNDMPADWPDAVRARVREALITPSPTAVAAALRACGPFSREARPFTVGLCSTFTVAPLLPVVELAMATLGLSPRVVAADPGGLEAALASDASPLAAADAVVTLWRLEDLLPNLVAGALPTAENRRDAVHACSERLLGLLRGARTRFSAPVFAATLPPAAPLGRGLADFQTPWGVHAARAEVNRQLLGLASQGIGLNIFDFSGWAEQLGVGAFDRRLDLYAHQPIARTAQSSLALALRRALAPLVRSPRKVLALDLDNTLWGGLLGDDGVAGLTIGHEFPGNVYRRIQLAALALKRQGVLLALLSKNDDDDVVQAFSRQPDMPLRLSDFAARRVDWNNKPDNLLAIAAELGLDAASFVFLDDQAFERQQMTFRLPQVAVLDAGDDPLALLEALETCAQFDLLEVLDADRKRAEDYARQHQRQQDRERTGSPEEFLRSAGIVAAIRPLTGATVARAVQMLQKTNQFNVTTRRHDDGAVRRLMNQPGGLALTLDLGDRYGGQGIVGLAIAVPEANQPDALMLDSFLISCRALGRGAERALFAVLLRRAGAAGFTRLRAQYRPTARNGPCATVFDDFGMAVEHRDADGAADYRLALPAPFAVPDWITVTEDEA
jgi:FkbH-like protein